MTEKFKTDHPGIRVEVIGVHTYRVGITIDSSLGTIEKSVSDCYTIETDERVRELANTLSPSSDDFLKFLGGLLRESLPAEAQE